MVDLSVSSPKIVIPKRDIRELPILFQGPMVRALLRHEDPKTQTRRTVKPTPTSDSREGWERDQLLMIESGPRAMHPMECPYGKPEDRLYVREAHYVIGETGQVFYRADDSNNYGDDLRWSGPWKPGIHMFRRHSRILLEVTEVRVQRLQDISEADCKAEGVHSWLAGLALDPAIKESDVHALIARYGTGYRAAYAALWESINGAGSWDANPFVWAVSFKRIKP